MTDQPKVLQYAAALRVEKEITGGLSTPPSVVTPVAHILQARQGEALRLVVAHGFLLVAQAIRNHR